MRYSLTTVHRKITARVVTDTEDPLIDPARDWPQGSLAASANRAPLVAVGEMAKAGASAAGTSETAITCRTQTDSTSLFILTQSCRLSRVSSLIACRTRFQTTRRAASGMSTKLRAHSSSRSCRAQSGALSAGRARFRGYTQSRAIEGCVQGALGTMVAVDVQHSSVAVARLSASQSAVLGTVLGTCLSSLSHSGQL